MGKGGLQSLSIKHLWAMAVLVGIFAFVNTHPIRPHDFWWHMAVGREIVETGRIPATDVYSQSMAGHPYPSYKMFWLAEIGLYAVYRVGGAPLSILVQSLIVTLAYGIILLVCFRISRNWRISAFGVIFAAALGLNNWNIRPQIVTYLLGALFLLAIYEYRSNRRKAWLLVFPAAMLVWANSHGSFPIGLVLLSIWLLDEVLAFLISRSRRPGASDDQSLSCDALSGHGSGGEKSAGLGPPLAAMVLTVLAAFVSPRGTGVFSYVLSLTADSTVRNLVPEWAPPTFQNLGGILFYSGLSLISVIQVLSPRRPTLFQVLCYAAFAALALKTTRGVVWFGLVMAPILSNHLAALHARARDPQALSRTSGGVPAINVAFAVLLLFIAFISLPWFKDTLRFSGKKSGVISVETPIQATRFLLAEHPPAPLFNTMSFGSYLIWAAQPEYRVFVDSRIELYPPEIWHDYILLTNAVDGWEKRLAHYGIQTLMLCPEEQPALLEAARASADWVELYHDPHAVILTRTSPAPTARDPVTTDP